MNALFSYSFSSILLTVTKCLFEENSYKIYNMQSNIVVFKVGVAFRI